MLTMFKVSVSVEVSVFVKVPVSIAIRKRPFTTALVIVIATAFEFARETSRLSELVLRGRVVAGDWIREVRFDSWGTLVANGFYVRVAEEPGDVVGLLHGVCCGGRGGRGGYL